MFCLHNSVRIKKIDYCNLLLWYPYLFQREPFNERSLWTNTKNSTDKKTSPRVSKHVHGQILHTVAQREIKLPLILSRLSDKETHRRGLCIFQNIFLIKERKEQQS